MKNKTNKNQGTDNTSRNKTNVNTDRETTLNENTNQSQTDGSDAEELSDIHKKQYPDHRIISEDSEMEGGQGGLTHNRKNETTAGFNSDNDDYENQSDQNIEDENEYNDVENKTTSSEEETTYTRMEGTDDRGTGRIGNIDDKDNLTGSRQQANTQGTGNEINRNLGRQGNTNS